MSATVSAPGRLRGGLLLLALLLRGLHRLLLREAQQDLLNAPLQRDCLTARLPVR